MTTSRKLRLGYLVSHPIQYQAPLLRRIAQEPDIDLRVFYGSDFSLHSYQDEGFRADVHWDIPLLDGYRSEFLPVLRDTRSTSVASPLNTGIYSRLRGSHSEPGMDVLWLHGYSTINTLHGMLVAKALDIPVLLRADIWLRDRPRSYAKLLAKQLFFTTLRHFVDAVLPIGTLNSEYWSYYLGSDFPKFLMPYAVDNSYFQARSQAAASSREALTRELNMEAGHPVILFASKLQTRKRCKDLVEAFLNLSAARSGLQPYLLIVGDGEERSTLERQVAASGSTRVRFCGFRNQSELPRFFDLCDVFVLPSQHEPWGLIVNEVMNAGRPVIVSDDVGSYPDLVRDGTEGFVFPVGDVDALTQALDRVLATPENAISMGLRALDRIRHWSLEEDILALRAALAFVSHRIRS